MRKPLEGIRILDLTYILLLLLYFLSCQAVKLFTTTETRDQQNMDV